MMIRFDIALTGLDNDVTMTITAPIVPRKLPITEATVAGLKSLLYYFLCFLKGRS